MTPHVKPVLIEIHRQVVDLLERRDYDTLRALLKANHPADIADTLELLNEAQRVAVFELLQTEVAAEVLDETSIEATRDIVEAVPDEKIADLLEAMPMDDAAEVLSELPQERAGGLIALMEADEAAEVEALLAHPEETAGRLMTQKVVRLRASWDVARVLEHLRDVDPETETLAYLYVVDDEDRLVGVVPVRDLLTCPPDTRMRDLMNRAPISVRLDTDQEEVARVVTQYDFLAIPVVDHAGRLKGIITHDDVMDILQDEFTEDVQRFGGSQPLSEPYLSTPTLMVARKRVGWLLVLFLTEMLTGSVMRLFEGELQAMVALSFFIPLMIGTGGNAGSQTTSTIVRALAVGEVRFADLWRLLWRELRTGLLLGVVMGAAGFFRALTWGSPEALALVVGVSLLVLVVWASSMGALLPVVAARLRVDPAIISGPVMSTLVDATGLLIYFSLARVIVGV